MELKQCKMGHYYDYAKSHTCPWCEMEMNEKQEKKEAFVPAPQEASIVPPVTAEPVQPVTGWLVAMTGPHKGQDFRLIKERNFIGRAEDNQVCLREDESVSRQRHCSVIYDPRSCSFVALAGESTATALNGEPLSTSANLRDGDVLSLGETKLCFVSFCREGRNWE